MLDLERFEAMLSAVNGCREPELLLLNGHLLVERTLVGAAGARLGCPDSDVPKLSFRTLVSLAFRDDTEARVLVVFNDLRNTLAHEFAALESRRFAQLVESLGFEWPAGRLERSVTLQLIVYDSARRVIERMVEEVDRPPLPPSQEEEDNIADLQSWSDLLNRTTTNAAEALRQGHWDVVINVLKPPGRPRPA